MKHLVSFGANVLIYNNESKNLLHIASAKDQPALFCYLIKQKRTQNLRNISYQTHLHIAVEKGILNNVICLIKEGPI